MTARLYYQDPYVATFEATVVQHVRSADQLSVILDKTHFYPTSGGQPCDLGTINGVPVLDVSIQEKDGAILHLLADEIWDDHVHAEIDWSRRFDHMQQHTGQHILSAAFVRITDSETIGFHLGAEASTIDLNAKKLLPAQIEQVEELVNEIIFSNRPVRSTIVSSEQAARLPLRKQAKVLERVRIVDIGEFDLNACGGTHVSNTGQVGLLKIVGLEHRGRGLRVEFLCGWRALADYRFKNHLVNKLSNEFTVSNREIDQAISRFRHEVKALRSRMRKANTKLIEYEAGEMLRNADVQGKLRVVSAVFTERDQHEISLLAKILADQPGLVILLGVAGDKSHILFARAQDVDRDMRLLLKAALRVLGSTAGGGRPEMAQGGGPAADEERVEQAVSRAKRLLLAQKS